MNLKSKPHPKGGIEHLNKPSVDIFEEGKHNKKPLKKISGEVTCNMCKLRLNQKIGVFCSTFLKQHRCENNEKQAFVYFMT